jgi:hypothetical protein
MMLSHHKIIVTIVMILLTGRLHAIQAFAIESSDNAHSQNSDFAYEASPESLMIAEHKSDSQTILDVGNEGDLESQALNYDKLTYSPVEESFGYCDDQNDRLWMISTRHLSAQACNANLNSVDFRVSKLDRCGNKQPDQFESFLSSVSPGRTVVIHVHGNRLTESEANTRGRFVYRNVKCNAPEIPMDYVIFSWPAEQRGLLIRDGRTKAKITEAESLYLATLLRELAVRNIRVAIVAYSFGCRVVSGGLHCLAGGSLSGRCLPTEPIVGANIAVGMIAPAVQADWLANGCYHGLATKNISNLTILYNSRDAVLKRFWLVELDSRGPALGYAGPRRIAPGFDGMPVPLIKCDCARFLGLAHNEQEYYTDGCNAGRSMATLIRKTR